ncbi:MAG TPA: hypothetical protein VIC87_07330, partial [Vicinamibacteria bacterium]
MSPLALVEARSLLHHAAQLAAAPGRSLVPPRPDDGHTALEWLAEARALAGEPVSSRRGHVRTALQLQTATLLLLGDDDAPLARRALGGAPLDAAFAWLGRELTTIGIDATRLSRDAPYEIPAHGVSSASPFPEVPLPEYAELARYFGDADLLLRRMVRGRVEASPVRCWPHHFDVGAVLTSSSVEGGSEVTVGLGLSPGDESIAEPYLYVNVWPPPARLPEPPPPPPGVGAWHREGWVGAELRA